ncbi:TetR/AcrR family transcriptional regulator [Alicyclobacillus kakegawensis]|uniref:TetR/AcrR family transcriptional regulator n=1 Tax=Alicyclobacillus kakegawensis TaxID=392012 RepID=UPI0024804EEC|nr:TetR/AcrR family transcriptional regulator [Alicyclobacillus kakegawensis]
MLRAAVQVMAESGYHHAQISRIARAAGVADGTVYLYFKNKEDILVSLLRRSIQKIVSTLQDALGSIDGAAEKLQFLVHLYLRELGADPELAMVTQVHMRQVDAGIRRAIGEFMKPFYSVLDEIVEAGVTQGVFHEPMDRRIARRMIFGTMDETVTAWVLSGSKYDLYAQADAVVDVLLHGLCGKPVDCQPVNSGKQERCPG